MKSIAIKTKELLSNWAVSYDPYSDVLQVYDQNIFNMPKNSLSTTKKDNFMSIKEKNSEKPVLIQVKKAYNTFGLSLDKLNKKQIIKLVEPKIKEIK